MEQTTVPARATIAKQCIFIRGWGKSAWKRILDLPSWPNWNPSVRVVELTGTPEAGARGRFYLKSGPATPFEISAVGDGKFIRLESPMFWLKIVQELRIVEIAEGTVVTFEISCSGRAERLAGRVLGRVLANVPENALLGLKTEIEQLGELEAITSVRL